MCYRDDEVAHVVEGAGAGDYARNWLDSMIGPKLDVPEWELECLGRGLAAPGSEDARACGAVVAERIERLLGICLTELGASKSFFNGSTNAKSDKLAARLQHESRVDQIKLLRAEFAGLRHLCSKGGAS